MYIYRREHSYYYELFRQYTMKPSSIRFIIEEFNKDAIFLKGFDEALIGPSSYKTNVDTAIAAYDVDKCLNILIDKFEMDEQDACDHFQDKIKQIKASPNNPIFVNDFRLTKDLDDWNFDELEF